MLHQRISTSDWRREKQRCTTSVSLHETAEEVTTKRSNDHTCMDADLCLGRTVNESTTSTALSLLWNTSISVTPDVR